MIFCPQPFNDVQRMVGIAPISYRFTPGTTPRRSPPPSTTFLIPCILIVPGLKVSSALQMPWTVSIKYPCLGGIVGYLVVLKHYTG